MIQLDVRSIVTANFAYTTVIALFLLFFGYRNFRRLPGLNWWAYGFVLITSGFLVIGFRNYIPVLVSDIVPHTFTLLGYLLIKYGLSKYYDAKPRLLLDSLLIAVAIVGLGLSSGRGVHFRVSVVVLSALGVYLLTLTMIWKDPDTVTLKYLYISASVIQVIRLWIGFAIPSGTPPMEAGSPLAVISMLHFLSLMFISLALVSITVRRLLREKEVLLEKERRNAITDELTGLMNRRGFKAVYEVEEKRSVRRKSLITLVMADIDGFKAINDRHGHECGDDVLRYVAEIFRKEFRGGDILARWGGEEFLIVQPETDAKASMSSLERTRQAIAREAFRIDDEVFYVTMSFGAHTAVAGELGFVEHLKKADDNMYKAKKSGRNRVVDST